MAHNIFGERFLSYRQPAWHALGTVSQEEMGAEAALQLIGGDVVVTLRKVFALMPPGTEPMLLELPNRAIIRHPTPDDPVFVPFGVVGTEYVPITLGDVATAWDEHVNRPVETMALLRRGAMGLITTKLPSIDVKGDEVEMYLGATAPLDGATAATAEIWPLRVVCQNTLNAAQSRAKSVYRVDHSAGAVERMALWLKDAYQTAENNVAVLREAFTVLANVRVTEADAKGVIEKAYPEPRPIERAAPKEVQEKWQEQSEALRRRVHNYRTNAYNLFEGGGMGSGSRAAKGTLWGAFNAVVECEDYRKSWNRDGLEPVFAAEQTLFGPRAETKKRAYEACLQLVR